MARIAWLFRSHLRKQHSIENVFGAIRPYIDGVEEYYLPNKRYNSLKAIIDNLRYVKTIDADIYHITGEIYFVGLVLPRHKLIITIHDYGGLDSLKGIKRVVFDLLWFRIPMRRCAMITCISKKVTNDTIHRYPFTKDKIVCIHDPIYDGYIRTLHTFNDTCPIILVVGTGPSKNISRIIQAVTAMSCLLDIVGTLSTEQLELLQKEKIQYRSSSGISEEELIGKYDGCDIVCFPSVHEGFGLPIVEGQRTGRPVLTSNIEPLIEVSGGEDCACLVDPFDVAAIRHGIQMIIQDSEYRSHIIENGYINSLKYRSSVIAEEYKQEYSEIIKECASH